MDHQARHLGRKTDRDSHTKRTSVTVQDKETAAGFGITSKKGIRNNMESIRGMQGAVSQDWHDQNNGKDFGNTAKPHVEKLTAAGKADKPSIGQRVSKVAKKVSEGMSGYSSDKIHAKESKASYDKLIDKNKDPFD
jgi:hypothetical protein